MRARTARAETTPRRIYRIVGMASLRLKTNRQMDHQGGCGITPTLPGGRQGSWLTGLRRHDDVTWVFVKKGRYATEVMLYGVAEASASGQAEHREGPAGREGQEDHPAPPEGGAAGPQPAGCKVAGERRQARSEPRRPNAAGPLRGGQAEEHPRPLQHGEVGPDKSHPQGELVANHRFGVRGHSNPISLGAGGPEAPFEACRPQNWVPGRSDSRSASALPLTSTAVDPIIMADSAGRRPAHPARTRRMGRARRGPWLGWWAGRCGRRPGDGPGDAGPRWQHSGYRDGLPLLRRNGWGGSIPRPRRTSGPTRRPTSGTP